MLNIQSFKFPFPNDLEASIALTLDPVDDQFLVLFRVVRNHVADIVTMGAWVNRTDMDGFESFLRLCCEGHGGLITTGYSPFGSLDLHEVNDFEPFAEMADTVASLIQDGDK